MSTTSKISKRRKHAVQVEAPSPEEEEISTTSVYSIPEASWGAEPNFNLDLTLTSPSNPRNFYKMHFSKKKDESNKEGKQDMKGTAAMEPTTLVHHNEKAKSRIPASSPTTEVKVNTEGNLFKPTNVKPVQTLSPVAHMDGNIALFQGSYRVEPTENDPTVRTKSPTSNLIADLKIQANAEETGKNVSMKTPTLKTLCVPTIPQRHTKREETNRIGPKLSSRFLTGSTKKAEEENIPNMTNPKTISEIPCPNQPTKKIDSAPFCTKTPQVSFLSPKQRMQRTTNTSTDKKSQSNKNFNDKDTNSYSGLKPNVKFSNSKGAEVSKNCRDSTSNHSSTSLMGSRDTLDSKSSSDSKNSLDSKPVSRISARMNTDHKSLKHTKPDRSYPDETFAGSKTTVRSKAARDLDSHCAVHLRGPVYPMPRSDPKSIGVSTKPSSHLKSELETLPVTATPLVMLSYSLVSASVKTGSCVCSPGPQEDDKSSPCYVSGMLDPLATSSPKTTTRISSKVTDCSKLGLIPNESLKRSSNRFPGLSLALSFTKTKMKTVVGKEHLNEPQDKVKDSGGPLLCPEGATVVERAPGDMNTTSLTTQLGTEMIISSGGNILLSGTSLDNEAMKSLSASGPLFSPDICLATSKMVKDAWTMTDHHGRQSPLLRVQKEVGIQVAVETSDCSTSTSPSSVFGPPICQPAATTSGCSVSAERSSLKHVCKIDIELRGQNILPSVMSDKSQSLPACLRTYSFQEEPRHMAPLGPNQDKGVSADSVWEDNEEDEAKAEKPQAVAWDKQGMTWEVYGASVDLESLGTAIQSHLESKIRDQEKHIRTLRKSICSDGNLLSKKQKKGRGGALVCCGGSSAVSD